MSSTDAKPGYDPSDKLNNPDTDWLETFHNQAIERHRAELAAARDEVIAAVEADIKDAVKEINTTKDDIVSVVEEDLYTYKEPANKP